MNDVLQRLFNQYQPNLIKLANREDARYKLFGLTKKEISPNKKIVYLGPNLYITREDNGLFKATIRTYNLFASKLAYSLSCLDILEFSKYINKKSILKENLTKYCGLLHYTGLLNSRYFPEIMCADLSNYKFFYSAGDGFVEYNGGGDWNTARNTANGNNNGSGSYDAGAHEASKVGSVYYCSRCFWYFDISSLGAFVTSIEQAILNIFIYSQVNEPMIMAQKGTQGSPLSNSDFWQFVGNRTPDGLYAYGGYTVETYAQLTFNALGISDVLAAINGTCKITTREYQKDYVDAAPVEQRQVGVYFSGNSGTDKDPKLEVYFGGAVLGTII
jgi:hypothetical protein